MDELLTIGEVGDEAGVPTSTLRYYDELGLVEPTLRIAGQRRYDAAALRRVHIVGLCQQAGFTLAEIREMLEGGREWRSLAALKVTELDRKISRLRDAKRLVEAALECDCDRLEGCPRMTHSQPQEICGEAATTEDIT